MYLVIKRLMITALFTSSLYADVLNNEHLKPQNSVYDFTSEDNSFQNLTPTAINKILTEVNKITSLIPRLKYSFECNKDFQNTTYCTNALAPCSSEWDYDDGVAIEHSVTKATSETCPEGTVQSSDGSKCMGVGSCDSVVGDYDSGTDKCKSSGTSTYPAIIDKIHSTCIITNSYGEENYFTCNCFDGSCVLSKGTYCNIEYNFCHHTASDDTYDGKLNIKYTCNAGDTLNADNTCSSNTVVYNDPQCPTNTPYRDGANCYSLPQTYKWYEYQCKNETNFYGENYTTPLLDNGSDCGGVNLNCYDNCPSGTVQSSDGSKCMGVGSCDSVVGDYDSGSDKCKSGGTSTYNAILTVSSNLKKCLLDDGRSFICYEYSDNQYKVTYDGGITTVGGSKGVCSIANNGRCLIGDIEVDGNVANVSTYTCNSGDTLNADNTCSSNAVVYDDPQCPANTPYRDGANCYAQIEKNYYCNNSTPPANNCRRERFSCVADSTRPCAKVDNIWQCSPYKCNSELMCGYAECSGAISSVKEPSVYNYIKKTSSVLCSNKICDLTDEFTYCEEYKCPSGFGVIEQNNKCYKEVCPINSVEMNGECYGI